MPALAEASSRGLGTMMGQEFGHEALVRGIVSYPMVVAVEEEDFHVPDLDKVAWAHSQDAGSPDGQGHVEEEAAWDHHVVVHDGSSVVGEAVVDPSVRLEVGDSIHSRCPRQEELVLEQDVAVREPPIVERRQH